MNALRRYAPLGASRGTVIEPHIRARVLARDKGCVGRAVGFPTDCSGGLELDHVRASHGMGMKSESSEDNLVSVCGSCHRWKTEHGREARPLLLTYLQRFYPLAGDLGHEHVDYHPFCSICDDIAYLRRSGA